MNPDSTIRMTWPQLATIGRRGAARDGTSRVGGPLEQALSDPRMDQVLHHNVQVYHDAGTDRVPATILSKRDSVVGRNEDATAIMVLLEGAAHGRKHP